MNDRIDPQYIPFRNIRGRLEPIYVTSNKHHAQQAVSDRVADGYLIAMAVVHGSEEGYVEMNPDSTNIPIDELKWYNASNKKSLISRAISALKDAGLCTTLDVQDAFGRALSSGRKLNISGYGEISYELTRRVFELHVLPLAELDKRLL